MKYVVTLTLLCLLDEASMPAPVNTKYQPYFKIGACGYDNEDDPADPALTVRKVVDIDNKRGKYIYQFKTRTTKGNRFQEQEFKDFDETNTPMECPDWF